ncbi:MAG: hypothetical protein J2P17_12065, partial [Mycobacterium sp.]|nr:hypothetical protein [Mycobacterium sp.]
RRRGRKYNTKHLNRTLFVALSAEFQGFCRDLHEDAAIHIAESIETVPGNAKVVPVVLDALVQERTVAHKKPTKGRRLDKGNANLDALSTDFSVLGMDLWVEVSKHYPKMAPKWRKTLDSLNYVRNGVAHSDAEKLAAAHREHGLTLNTFRAWRSSVNGVAHALDKVVGTYLLDLTGIHPW